MVTLINVYFEYIKILCQIFSKHIVPILQVYPNQFIKLIIIIIIICLYELHFLLT